MIPRRITMEGFMSYREKQTLDFDGHSLWVLSGPNGAGKSAVFDAITYALYGQYRGGEQQHAVRLINNQGASALKVTFEFQVGSRIYKVHRTFPRKGSPTWEAFELLDGKWERIEGEDSVRKSEDWVQRTIGLSYEAFTSSVVLLQGQSEQLLKAKPAKRYEILSELIEMSPYQELEARAERARDLHEAAANRLDGELQGLPVVPEPALLEAARMASAQETAYLESDREHQRWVRTHRGSMNHQRLLQECAERSTQLHHDASLLSRAVEIRTGLSRFHQLDAVLDTLQHIARLQQQLRDGTKALEMLETEAAASALREQRMGEELTKKEEEASGLLEQISACKSELAKLQDRLTVLAPVVDGLQLIEEQEKTLAELCEKLNQFPNDLSQQREEARSRAALIEEARCALDILGSLSSQRVELLEAEDESQKAQQQVAAARIMAEEIEEEEEGLIAEREQVHDRQRCLEGELSGVRVSCEDLEVRLNEFAAVAEQRQCSLCGQQINERHAEKEKARLLTQRTIAQNRIVTTKKQLDVESELADELEEQFKVLQERKAQVENERREAQAILKGLPRRMERMKNKLVVDFQRLPQVHQLRIWPDLKTSAIPWHETSYPREEDLRALKGQAEGRLAHSQRMRVLDEQHDQCIALRSQIQQTRETIRSWTEKDSKAARLQAREEQETLLKKRQRMQQDCQFLEQRHGETATAVRTHKSELLATRQTQQQQSSLRVEKQTLLKGWAEQWQQQVAGLPESWREKGTRLTAQDLLQAKSEHAGLNNFVQEEGLLRIAEQRQSAIQAQLDELKRQIDAIPQEERAAVTDVAKALEAAEVKRNDADEQRRKSLQHFEELQRSQTARIRLEQQHHEEARKHHLHKRLARLLGREELQRSLMRATERELVRLANMILSDLSRARMQLRLRHEDPAISSGKVREKQKALDLEFLNTETAAQWMDVELASGSQCFRIAISLALAIGSYFGREERRIESVIIDEGFGCLDKVNREDAIAVLNALQFTMKRIILVSHQDEFSHEFKNGYEMRLEDKSSRAYRMVV